LKDVAQPVCAADRHVKSELNKKVRGSREVERHAEQSRTQEAQVVADSCLAIRTVMRDEGKSPLEPPGLQLDQKLQLIAASGERVRAAHPSALRKKLSRMLAVVNVCQKEFEPLVRLCSWIHQIAHLLQTQTNGEEAQSQLWAFVQELKQRCLPTALLRVVTSVEKIPVAFAPQLFAYLKQPLLPRTHKDLERFIGRLKKSRRHITGRTNTPALILREGSFVALLFGLPHTNNWVDAFSKVNLNDFHDTLKLRRQTEKRSKCWQTRRDFGAYLSALEQPWVPQE
jgi:hypothetical protein